MTEQEWRERFGYILTGIIAKRGCTHKEFAEDIGISEKTLDHYIHGRRTPNARFLVNLAKASERSIDKIADFGEKIEK